jgi:hypothetical protein
VVSYNSGTQLKYLLQQFFGPPQNLKTDFAERLSEDPETSNVICFFSYNYYRLQVTISFLIGYRSR